MFTLQVIIDVILMALQHRLVIILPRLILLSPDASLKTSPRPGGKIPCPRAYLHHHQMDGDITKVDYLDRRGLSATVEVRILTKGVSLTARRDTLRGGCHGKYRGPARETAEELDTIGALVVRLRLF